MISFGVRTVVKWWN